MTDNTITHHIDGPFFVITLNNPTNLNALNGIQYLHLGKLMSEADAHPETKFTLLQSSGRYFSAGANVQNVAAELNASQTIVEGDDPLNVGKTGYWLNNFVSRNVYLTHMFYTHRKIIITALNGPVVGLSSALVALSDFIYAKDEKSFVLLPFANLGLVTEGAAAYSIVSRFGKSLGNEALLLSRPIPIKRLEQVGFVNKMYNIKDVNEFNAKVKEDFFNYAKNLDWDSMLDIKEIIRRNDIETFKKCNVDEVIGGLDKWVRNVPQNRFSQLAKGNRKHKL